MENFSSGALRPPPLETSKKFLRALRAPPPYLKAGKFFFFSNQKFDAELCSAIARIACPSLLRPIAAENRHWRVHNSPSFRAMIGIEPRCAKSYPSALAFRVLPLNRTRKNQQCQNSFGTLEDLSQDFKIVGPGTLSGPFVTLGDFFLGHYWTFYCIPVAMLFGTTKGAPAIRTPQVQLPCARTTLGKIRFQSHIAPVQRRGSLTGNLPPMCTEKCQNSSIGREV